MKRCTKCGEEKALDAFNKKRGGRYGVDSRCKECTRESGAEYYRINKKQVLARQAEYSRTRKREKAASDRAWRERNRDRTREYKARNRDRDNARRRERWRANPGRARVKNRRGYLRRLAKNAATPTNREGTKRCFVCRTVKPRTEFYASKQRKDGLHGECKRCSTDRGFVYKLKNRPKVRQRGRESAFRRRSEPKVVPVEKRCSKCGLTKPASEFYSDPREKSGLMPQCKSCELERGRERRKRQTYAGVAAYWEWAVAAQAAWLKQRQGVEAQ